jgi:membrane protein
MRLLGQERSKDVTILSPVRRLRTWLARLVKFVWWEFREHELSLRATGLVYTTLLSLVPFLAVAVSVLKAFGVHYQVEPFLARMLEPLGPWGGEITRRLVEFVNNLEAGILGALGTAGLFYTVISLLEKVEDAFNHIWRVRQPRTIGRKFTDYLSVVLVGPVLVVTALGLIASAQSFWLVQRVLAIGPLGGLLVQLGSRVMPFVFLWAAFTFLYWFVPHTRVEAGSALLGAAVAALLWELTGIGFSVFIAGSTGYTAIYSGFAVLVLFLSWLSLAWLVVLVGAEVAYFHQHPSAYLTALRRRSHWFRERVALSALIELTRRHLSGQAPSRPPQLARTLNVPLSFLEDLVETFVRRGILLRSAEPEGITLGRPPEQVTVTEVLETLGDPDAADSAATDEHDDRTDAVAYVLGLRERATHGALEGFTLRSLASEVPALEASASDAPARPSAST